MTPAILLIVFVFLVVGVYLLATRLRRRRQIQKELENPPPPGSPVIIIPQHEPAIPPCSPDISRYVLKFNRFQLAQSARLLVDGREAFPQMLTAIRLAQHQVDLETYLLRSDRTGRRFQQALIEAARNGVRVRLLYDYIGGLGLSDRFVTELLNAGVEVRVYHPLISKSPFMAVNRRDHRKVLIVDRQATFTGGLNIADDYAPQEEGGGGWRDTHVLLEGEAIAEWVERLFDYAWRTAVPYRQTATRRGRLRAEVNRRFQKPQTLHSLSTEPGVVPVNLCEPNRMAVQIIGNREFRGRHRIRAAYLHAINHARRYILIENAYFIPDSRIRRALVHAVRRGVFVGVVVAKDSDVTIAGYAGRHLYSRLISRGVRIFEWPGGMMHAKTAVIDDAWSVVGSYNFDHRSLLHQLELIAVIADPTFAVRLKEQTLIDISKCREVTLESHRVRPWYQKMLEPMAYWMRYWL